MDIYRPGFLSSLSFVSILCIDAAPFAFPLFPSLLRPIRVYSNNMFNTSYHAALCFSSMSITSTGGLSLPTKKCSAPMHVWLFLQQRDKLR